jgi:hypothetical protein
MQPSVENGICGYPCVTDLSSRPFRRIQRSTPTNLRAMPPTKAAPSGLLLYLREYGVLICRECQYAIQKSALRSHLLRHKIYRDERERLLSSVARLQLYEPDEVPLPGPGSPTISGLPLVSGFCCTAAKCGHLCASEKRMKRHWSDDHGRIIESSSFAS